jgi:hypothetical protein
LFFCPLAHRVGGHFADQPPSTPWEKNAGERLATWTNKIEHFVSRLEALHHCGLAPRPQAHTFCAPASKRFAALTRPTSAPSTSLTASKRRHPFRQVTSGQRTLPTSRQFIRTDQKTAVQKNLNLASWQLRFVDLAKRVAHWRVAVASPRRGSEPAHCANQTSSQPLWLAPAHAWRVCGLSCRPQRLFCVDREAGLFSAFTAWFRAVFVSRGGDHHGGPVPFRVAKHFARRSAEEAESEEAPVEPMERSSAVAPMACRWVSVSMCVCVCKLA